MDAQARVAEFIEANALQAPAAFRLLDTVSELGEVSKEVCTSTDYRSDLSPVGVPEDELGDALFALFALCSELDVDAEAAPETALVRYKARIADDGDAGSGE
jgi:NTP pyrophosphatase (non-canonical NTP hydrolase)